MRLIINVPDTTRPDIAARIRAITERLNQEPEFAAEIPMDTDIVDDAAIQRMFTPERLAHIAKAEAELDAGNSFTAEQVDEHFKRKHEAWNQSQH